MSLNMSLKIPWKMIWRVIKIIRILYPIVTCVYDAVQKKHPDKVSKHVVANADQVVIGLAKKAGINVGHTETELVRSAVHYVRAKSNRYKNLRNN